MLQAAAHDVVHMLHDVTDGMLKKVAFIATKHVLLKAESCFCAIF